MKKLILLLLFIPLISFGQDQKLKVYLDCRCDDNYIKQQTSFLEYVRDQDLADIENAEIEILTQYLPEQLNESEIDSIVQETIKENGAADITKMGMVMSIVKEKVKGQADMAIVSQKVKASLTE